MTPDQGEPTPDLEQQVRLHLLSDGPLYDAACTFVRDQQSNLPANSQLMGLLQAARTWNDLQAFIKHQLERDWGDPRYPDFYRALDRSLKEIVPKYVTMFVPEHLAKKDARREQDRWSGLLAREFIQHLYAQAILQPHLKQPDHDS
jgi:hypothetical protein